MPLSPLSQQAYGDPNVLLPGETEEQRRRRQQAILAAQNQNNAALGYNGAAGMRTTPLFAGLLSARGY